MVISQSGDPKGIRTPDRRLRKPLLYPAELSGRIYVNVVLDYSGDPKGIRTPDRRLRKPLLCPAELPGLKIIIPLMPKIASTRAQRKGN
jgi:hypothetical protein